MDTSLRPHHCLAFLIVSCCAFGAVAATVEHREFEATLHAPYIAPGGGLPGGVPSGGAPSDARTFILNFDYPGLQRPRTVTWQLELSAPGGGAVLRWQGSLSLPGGPVSVPVSWSGSAGGAPLASGIYRIRMRALSRDAGPPLSVTDDGEIEQSWEIVVGKPPAPRMPRFAPLPSGRPARPARAPLAAPNAAPAPAALPYSVYLGNLHSQTNHSDGGGELASCTGAQDPQSGRYGPDVAFAYAREHGLDLLVTSEHNHMYDGSDGTSPDADMAKAKALYRAGLADAVRFSAAHPDFLAVYGLEWGVIHNGGHLNIFNSPELLGWERNGKGELAANTETPRNDYGALYSLMKSRGWIGQFNHPSPTGQFVVNGVALGYTPDGDEVMTLCEVLNSTAFSTNETETETRRSNFEMGCTRALEAGYHVAFSSNQDNHCANWGASFTNRTGVLVPTGTPLNQASLAEALRARRVFATMDKASQLVLTANGHLMGERFANSGPLTLDVKFANTAGKTVASVSLMEGVPGRNGTVTELSTSATTTVTPAPGEHFYYAKLTQTDGNILWSAPVWVTQQSAAAAVR